MTCSDSDGEVVTFDPTLVGMESGSGKHGGDRDNAGRKPQHVKDVADPNRNPRITTFFPTAYDGADSDAVNPSVVKKQRINLEAAQDSDPQPHNKSAAPHQPVSQAPLTPATDKNSSKLPPASTIKDSITISGAGPSMFTWLKSAIQDVVTTAIQRLQRAVSSSVDSEVASIQVTLREETTRMCKQIEALQADLQRQRAEFKQEVDSFTESKKLCTDKDWIASLPNGRFVCLVCTRHQSHCKHGTQQRSKWLKQNGGVKYCSRFSRLLWSHENECEMHKVCVEMEAMSLQQPLVFAFETQFAEAKEATAKLFKITLDNALRYRAFLDYENVVYLAHSCGAEIGEQLHGRKVSTAMADMMYRTFRQQGYEYISTPKPATRALPYVGRASDKVSDCKYTQWIVVTGRIRVGGTPVTFLQELRKMGLTATGQDCYDQVVAAEEGMGCQAGQVKTSSFDGEACYSGEGTTAPTVKSLTLGADPDAEVIHDPPHAAEILKGLMHQAFPYIFDVHTIFREVYSNFAVHGKKLAGVVATATDMGVDWKQLHYIFEVRMVESEYIATSNFLADWTAIVEDFQQHLDNVSGTTEAMSPESMKIKRWLRRITEFKFIAVGLILLDIDKALKVFSKAGQSDANLVIDYPSVRERLQGSLTQLRDGVFGSHIKRNLAQLKQGKYAGRRLRGVGGIVDEADIVEHEPLGNDIYEVEGIVSKRQFGRGYQYLIKWKGYGDEHNSWEAASSVAKTAKGLVRAFEGGDTAEAQQASARDARAARRAELQESPVTDPVATEDVEALGAAVEQRLKAYMKAMVQSLLNEFENKLPLPPIMAQLRTIFDFRRMPFHEPSQLNGWSNSDIAAVVSEKFPHLDAELVSNQALQVRHWVLQQRSNFMVDVPAYDNDGDPLKAGKKVVTKKQLNISGPGSIMETLFSSADTLFPNGIHGYLEVADYMISYMVAQSDTERVGRNMTLTKSANRSSLGDVSFPQLVWLSFNAPPIHQVDFMKLVDIWIKEGHQLALFKSGGCARVLERFESTTKTTFIH